MKYTNTAHYTGCSALSVKNIRTLFYVTVSKKKFCITMCTVINVCTATKTYLFKILYDNIWYQFL
jgi:hypothetical protein